jgi:hypothetical protein
MPYTRAETIGKTAPRPPRLDPASVGQVPRGETADSYHVEAFWQAISHQAAARTARYAEASPAFSEEAAAAYHRHATGKTRAHSSHSLVQSGNDVGYRCRRLCLHHLFHSRWESAAVALTPSLTSLHVDQRTIARPALAPATPTVAGSDARERLHRALPPVSPHQHTGR